MGKNYGVIRSIVLLSALLGAKTCWAGNMEVVALPPYPWYPWDDITTWTQEAERRYNGTFHTAVSSTYNNSATGPIVTYPAYDMTFVESFAAGVGYEDQNPNLRFQTGDSAMPRGGEASITMHGTVRTLLKWHRNTYTDPNGNQIGDPDDNPPPYVYLKVTLGCGAGAQDLETPYDLSQGYQRDATKEHASVQVTFSDETLGLTEAQRQITVLPQDFANIGIRANFNQTVLLKVATAGMQNDEVLTKPIIVDATASLDGNRRSLMPTPGGGSAYNWNPGYVTAGLDYTVELTDYKAFISSDIETSFRKVTNRNDVPKKKNPDGTVVLGADGQEVIEDDPRIVRWAAPGGNGPWAVRCKPGVDGVHSAATWLSPAVAPGQTATPGWYGITAGNGEVKVNSTGFAQPGYSWSVAGGTLDGGASVEPTESEPVLQLKAQLKAAGEGAQEAYGIKVGSSPTALAVPSTTFQATVSELEPSLPLLMLSDTYTINWHRPIENVQTVGTPQKTYTRVPGTVVNGYPTVIAPGAQTKVLLDPKWYKGTLLLSKGEQIAVGVGVAVLTRGASVAIGKSMSATQAAAVAMLGWFYNIELNDAAMEPEFGYVSNTEAEWQKAVNSTRDALNQVPGADVRVLPTDIAGEEISSTRWLSCTMTPWVKGSSSTTFTRGDEYDGNGFVGHASGKIEADDTVEVVGCYEYDGRPPTM